MDCKFMWLLGIPTIIRGQRQSPCTALTTGLSLGLCKGSLQLRGPHNPSNFTIQCTQLAYDSLGSSLKQKVYHINEFVITGFIKSCQSDKFWCQPVMKNSSMWWSVFHFSDGPEGKNIKAWLDSLVQDCSNSIANALELLQSCTKPSDRSSVQQSWTD